MSRRPRIAMSGAIEITALGYSALGKQPPPRPEPSEAAYHAAVEAAVPQLPGEIRENIESAVDLALLAAWKVDFPLARLDELSHPRQPSESPKEMSG